MKKILLTLSFVFAMLIMNGQIVINISGSVHGSTGGNIPNYPVQIMSDSTMGFMYYGTATTDANGNYNQTITFPAGVIQGLFYVSIQDSCTGLYHTQNVFASPNVLNITGINFVMCQIMSSCAATFTSTTSGSNVNFTSSATGGTAPYSYSWDFGDGTMGTGANPTHTYNVSGLFLPCLTVIDATGCIANFCDTISVGTGVGACAAGFNQSVQGNVAAFTSTSTGGNPIFPLLHIWDFGDGTNAYTNNPTHTYTNPGTYLVCLTVTDSICFSTYCDTIVIGNGVNCNSSFSASVMDSLVTFVPQVTGTAPFIYVWNFGDGTVTNTANPAYVYTSNGNYMACLTVTDANGCSSTSCNMVTITAFSGSSCSVSFTHQAFPATGFVNFTSTATGGVAPYSYVWSFGDGSNSTSQNPSHSYSVQGTYIACLTITDSLGCTATYCDSLFAWGGGSSCSASFSYQTNAVGGISFTSSPTGVAPFAYVWDFGDGTLGSTANPTHTYLPPSTTYNVTLTITDATGCTSTYTALVVSAGGNPCQASYTYTTTGNTVAFASSMASGAAPYTYLWDLGDGNTSQVAHPTHIYSTSGSYIVCLTVTDTIGCTSVYCDSVVVNNGGSFGYLSGMVIADSLFPAQAVVHLISYDSTTSSFTVTATDTTLQGNFTFSNIPSGHYLVRAALLTSDPNFSNYLPTYYTQTLYWTNATAVNVDPSIFQFIVVPLIQGTNSTGVAVGQNFIGGTVGLSIFKGGGAAPNVPVFILEQDMTAFDYTLTDSNGDYEFQDLPNGVYYIYVEEIGLLSTPIQVTVNNGTTSIDDVDFEMGNYYVTFTDTDEILSIEQLSVFPNPVQSQLNVQLTLTQSMDVNITVMNVTGQVIRQNQYQMINGQNDVVIPTSDLPSGVYMLRLETNDGVVTEKFVKN